MEKNTPTLKLEKQKLERQLKKVERKLGAKNTNAS